MRKTLALAIALAIILSLIVAGCAQSTPATTQAPATSAPATTTAPTTSAPTSAPATTSAPTSAAAQAQTINLKIATFMPANHYVQSQQLAALFKMVEKKTNGKYTFNNTWYPSGTLLANQDIYDGVVKNVVDMGQISMDYTPGRFPVMSTFLISGVAPQNNCNDSARMAWDFFKTYDSNEFKDVHVLYVYGIGPGALHTKVPITTIDALKGMKIRATATTAPGVQALGAEAVNMPMADVYESAKKGLFDALVSPPETLKAWKHNEIFKYSVPVPGLYGGIHVIGMNQKVWDSLPKEVQDAFNSSADDIAALTGEIWEYYQQDGYNYAKSQPGGHEITQLPATEIAKMTAAFQPGIDKYIAELNSKGFKGADIVNQFKTTAAKYNNQTFPTWTPAP